MKIALYKYSFLFYLLILIGSINVNAALHIIKCVGTTDPKLVKLSNNIKPAAIYQDDNSLRDSIKMVFEKLHTENNWVNNITENATLAYPFGMQKTDGGTTYEIAFNSIVFNSKIAIARVFARCILPELASDGKEKILYFEGMVNISRTGGIISDGKLILIGNEQININNYLTLSLNGKRQNENATRDYTFFKFNCSGFELLGIRGSIILSDSKFISVDRETFEPILNEKISAPVSENVTSWNSLFISDISFNSLFSVKDIPHYIFSIKKATLDLDDQRNPVSNKEFDDYIKNEEPLLPNTWRGLYINQIETSLPEWFNGKESNKRTKVKTIFGLIDDNGFNSKITDKNILNINNGDASGWPFSVDTLSIKIEKNQIEYGFFAGKIILPIENKRNSLSGLDYTGKIEDSSYSIFCDNFPPIHAALWKATLVLNKASIIELNLKNGKFIPYANLSGELKFNVSATNEAFKNWDIKALKFEELILNTEKPYLYLKTHAAETKVDTKDTQSFLTPLLYNYKADLKGELIPDKIAQLSFWGNVQPGQEKIRIVVTGYYDSLEQQWINRSIAIQSKDSSQQGPGKNLVKEVTVKEPSGSGITDTIPPAPPRLLSVTAINKKNNRVEWIKSVSKEVQKYIVYKMESEDTVQVWHELAVLDFKDTVYIDKLNKNNSINTYAIKAIDDRSLKSKFSNLVSIKNKTDKPVKNSVTNFSSFVSEEGKYIELTWGLNNIKDIKCLYLFRSDGSGKFNVKRIACLNAAQKLYDDQDIQPNSYYVYYLKTVTKDGGISKAEKLEVSY